MINDDIKTEWKSLNDKFKELNGYTLVLTGSKKILGSTDFRNKTISLSKYHVLNSPMDKVIDTLRHEAAHVIAGINANHGYKWVEACGLTGAVPERCGKVPPIAPHNFFIECGNGCFKPIGIYRRSDKVLRSVCRTCKQRVIISPNSQNL